MSENKKSNKKNENKTTTVTGATAGGGHSRKKGSSQKPPNHDHHPHKSADITNITNGIQRLQIDSKHPHPHQKVSPVISQHHQHHEKVGRPKSTGNDVFAQKDLYAGAGFDMSPAASSLPIPKFGAGGKSPVSKVHGQGGEMRSVSVDSLLRSGQTLSAPISSHLAEPMKSPLSSHSHLSEAEQLRLKSQYLMKVFTSKEPKQATVQQSHQQLSQPPPNTEQLEEMTAQVRRMLNL